MPGDVAVEWPDAGVVGKELEDDECGGAVLLRLLEDLCVAAVGVGWTRDGAIPSAEAFSEDLVCSMSA